MKEIRRCLIFLDPVNNSMLTRAIFIRPDSELIRESVCACAKLFVDEENVILTKYHYIIITDYPGSNFIDIFLKLC
jgi:hypothetical protein